MSMVIPATDKNLTALNLNLTNATNALNNTTAASGTAQYNNLVAAQLACQQALVDAMLANGRLDPVKLIAALGAGTHGLSVSISAYNLNAGQVAALQALATLAGTSTAGSNATVATNLADSTTANFQQQFNRDKLRKDAREFVYSLLQTGVTNPGAIIASSL